MIDIFHIKPERLLFAFNNHMKTEDRHLYLDALDAGWYRRVASIGTDDLEQAWDSTQNIEGPWCTESYRSTMIGDIAIRGNDIYVIASLGFKHLGNLDVFPSARLASSSALLPV